MKYSYISQIALAFAFSSLTLFAQVSSQIVGTVVDPADAAVANAPVTLTSTDTGAVRTATTDTIGTYRFTNVNPGTYSVGVKATGFKSFTQGGVVVTANETHTVNKITLQLGNVSESISVTDEVAQVQLSSSEKSQTVDAKDLDSLTLKGRDLFGYIRLVPGVVDTANRDVTSHGAISGMNINGGFTALNFVVDGITDMDTGSNTSVQYEPNLDAVQELKVLTSNYQAEFGHTSGGTITVVTKNGTQEFHGSAAWNHRHEEFNSDTWLNNHTIKNGAATPRVPYRYNVETYSIGGPIFIPKHWNRDRKKAFFFWSQERTGQFVAGSTQTKYTPTALERNGDFSQSFNNNGTLIKVLDPDNNNVQFAGNKIAPSRIDAAGQSVLNFFPLPNYDPTLPSQLHVINYTEQGSAIHPRLNSVLRGDYYFSSKLSGYFRFINDADYMYQLFSGVQFAQDEGGLLGAKGIAPIIHPNGGHSESGTLTYTITPTMVNETTLGYTWDQYTFTTTDNFATEARSLLPLLPTLFPIPKTDEQGPINGYADPTILPTFVFGGAPANSMTYERSGASAGQEIATNPTWYYIDNLSKVVGRHALKAGIYVEFNTKYQCACKNYAGNFNFATNAGIPFLNTNDAYANALLGHVNSYNQNNAELTFNVVYQNYEWYMQDNWKVGRRLTLDLGARFYHQSPQDDNGHTFVNFLPSKYNAATQSRLYVPACAGGAATCTAGKGLEAMDPATGNLVSNAFIAKLVPNSGDAASGSAILGVNGVSEDTYHQQAVVVAPRIGFSYDLFGDGKTALRGGWGVFYNRLDGNQYYGLSAQAPASYNVGVNDETLADISAQNTGAVPSINTQQGVTPISMQAYPAEVPWDTVQNASLGIQRTIGNSWTVDVGYTHNRVYHQHISAGCCNVNYIPIGTGWPFNKANIDPTTAGGTTPNSLPSDLLRTKYPGYGSINMANFSGHSNYNALTSTLNKRLTHGLTFGLSYTFSRALGTTSFNPVVPDNEAYNYGRISTDRTHNLQVSYSYDIPGIAKKMHWKAVGYVTDNWQLSGITSSASGSPTNPSCGLTSGQPGPTGGYTGTPDLGTRCLAIGNPFDNIGSNGNGKLYFNPSAFAMPALATGPNNSIVGPPVWGNMGGGAGVFTNPHVTNFDMTLTKMIPLGNEKRIMKLQAQAYNVFNHAEYSGYNEGIQFDTKTNLVSNPLSLGYPNNTVNGSNRILAFSARVEF
ncbi:MAG TPA: TonB-dependent receptor [Bryobacteraceae bacterium]|nr:TonB-dependent receptor [Bryobacteraceae bacterium]